jgi:WD40 repeat protein
MADPVCPVCEKAIQPRQAVCATRHCGWELNGPIVVGGENAGEYTRKLEEARQRYKRSASAQTKTEPTPERSFLWLIYVALAAGILCLVTWLCIRAIERHRAASDLNFAFERSWSGYNGAVKAIGFSPDSTMLVTGDSKGVALWNVASARVRRLSLSKPFPMAIDSVAFSPSGAYVAAAGSGIGPSTIFESKFFFGNKFTLPSVTFFEVALFAVDSGSRTGDVAVSAGTDAVAFTSEGACLVSAGFSLDLYTVPGLASGCPLYRSRTGWGRGSGAPFESIAMSRDGRWGVAGAADGGVWLWPMKGNQGGEKVFIGAHAGGVRAVAFSGDGHYLASGGADKSVKIWDPDKAKELRTIKTGEVNALAFSPKGPYLATAGPDGNIQLWNVPDGRLIRTLTGHIGPVFSLSFSRDGDRLASSGYDTTIKFWHRDTSTLISRMKVLLAEMKVLLAKWIPALRPAPPPKRLMILPRQFAHPVTTSPFLDYQALCAQLGSARPGIGPQPGCSTLQIAPAKPLLNLRKDTTGSK